MLLAYRETFCLLFIIITFNVVRAFPVTMLLLSLSLF